MKAETPSHELMHCHEMRRLFVRRARGAGGAGGAGGGYGIGLTIG